MALYAGFDEAGYGSMLGPMAVGCSAFRVPEAFLGVDDGRPRDLWTALSSAVCRKSGDRRNRLAIADSKALKGRGGAELHDAALLERGVLAALHARESDGTTELPADDHALAAHLGAGAPPEMPPWNAGAFSVPFACDGDDARVAGRALRRALDTSGCALQSLGVRAVEVPALNDAFDRGISKPSIPFAIAMDLAHRLMTGGREHSGWLAFDAQGGRMRYRDDLCRACPGATVSVIVETQKESRYTVHWASAAAARTFTVSFGVAAERSHLPVALASMAAKYVRELRMERFNRYFIAQSPELRPTAGYVQDGRRFLADAAPTLARLGLEQAALVRCK